MGSNGGRRLPHGADVLVHKAPPTSLNRYETRETCRHRLLHRTRVSTMLPVYFVSESARSLQTRHPHLMR